jgi:hypothetical protein
MLAQATPGPLSTLCRAENQKKQKKNTRWMPHVGERRNGFSYLPIKEAARYVFTLLWQSTATTDHSSLPHGKGVSTHIEYHFPLPMLLA